MYDVVISIAGIQASRADGDVLYVGTRVFRIDLDEGPDEIAKFIDHIQKYPGVAHVESLGASPTA